MKKQTIYTETIQFREQESENIELSYNDNDDDLIIKDNFDGANFIFTLDAVKDFSKKLNDFIKSIEKDKK
mgnify:FL=1